jgi:choline dehydrogenase
VEDEYDYVIVGAGAAGCVLASRLSADPSIQVLLVEAGGSTIDPMIRVPKGLYFLLGGGKYAYNYETLPAGPQGAVEHWVRGKLVGGSTSINGMQYHRGDPWFWDEIERRGNHGWAWSEMARVFREIENHEFGATDTRGEGGPLDIHVSRDNDKLTWMILEAAGNLGLRHVVDINEPGVEERIGFVPNTVKNGVRESSDTAFLRPVMRRRNLTLACRAQAGNVLFDGNSARGVRLHHKGQAREVRARREVLVSAGAVESVLLLERSGVGNADVLGRHAIPVRVESPNLGERVLEQRMNAYQAKLSAPLGYNARLDTFIKQMYQGARYLLSRKGVIGTGAYELVAFHKSSPEAPTADLVSFISPLSLDVTASKMAVARHPGFMVNGQLLHPTTESSVHISGSDPDAPPVIDAHFLETDYDRTATPTFIEFARNLAAQSPLAEVITEEEVPGPQVTSPEQLIAHSWASGHIFHATGAAAMGTGDDDVVDSELRVRGAKGVRIVDASVFPLQPGNTAGPTMAMAWRAADKILAEH